jgi:cytoskeletal protein RodZ
MKTFFRDLKSAREARGITLQQIADATLINIAFLDALERGNDGILPHTYVRAFIREYAQVVGLNPDETMRRYDESRHLADQPAGAADVAESGPRVSAPPPPILIDEETVSPPPSTGPFLSTEPRRRPTIRIAALGALAIVVLTVLYQLAQHSATPPTEEIPFQNVVREAEKRSAASQAATATSVPASPADSLSLRAVITDSVWVSIIIDREPPREYLFTGPTRASWRARERFVVTLGNAGAVQFALNQREIGVLGSRGAVVREVELNRRTLEQQPPH